MLLGFGQFKNLLFSKELVTRTKKNFAGKEQSHKQQHLIQQCFPSNQRHRPIFSFVQSFKSKKKKYVTQNIKFVCFCVDNIFFPKFDIIRDK